MIFFVVKLSKRCFIWLRLIHSALCPINKQFKFWTPSKSPLMEKISRHLRHSSKSKWAETLTSISHQASRPQAWIWGRSSRSRLSFETSLNNCSTTRKAQKKIKMKLQWHVMLKWRIGSNSVKTKWTKSRRSGIGNSRTTTIVCTILMKNAKPNFSCKRSKMKRTSMSSLL